MIHYTELQREDPEWQPIEWSPMSLFHVVSATSLPLPLALVLTVGAPSLALADESIPSPPLVPTSECPVLDPPPSEEDLDRYLCGDPRLGPTELPADGPVGELVEGYDRFGDLSPAEFLDRWATEDGWDYPEHDGFVVENGSPLKELQELPEGWMLDRFGSPWGSFLAPAGAPFSERALPPDSLNTWPDGAEHNYNCYEVVLPIDAWVGPIAPHFEQPGGGEQLLIPTESVPEAGGQDGGGGAYGADDGGYVSVHDLLEWDYLDQRPAEECVFPKEFAA